MSVLVLGSTGQVGQYLQSIRPQDTFWTRDQLDLSRNTTVESDIVDHAPSLIVNVAAFTAVDRAESESIEAWQVNAESVAAIARAARSLDVPLIHVSTDYVFGGEDTSKEHHPGDATRPSNTYGRSKLAGELAVATLASRYWILRTSWVFGAFGSNFVKTILRLARERDSLSIVDDQWGRPTFAGDIASAIDSLIAAYQSGSFPPFGTHHLAGDPATTWCRFAVEIVHRAQQIGLIARLPEIHGITTDEYPTPAKRPMNSMLALDPEFIAQLQVNTDWREGLEHTLRALH
ncbi:MAG: dTDP-4-dehydrorhamnose reductase [Pseudomonadales bacterium]